MELGLTGRHALVMGASSGLGKAIATTLTEEGAKVAICARGRERLEATAAAIGAIPIVCDLSRPDAATVVALQAERSLGGPIDILVTNTGGPPTGAFMDVSSQDWRDGFQGLWLSAVEAIQAVIPAMVDRKWGRVLLITSVAAKEPVADLTVSNGLRAGLHGLANSLSREVGRHGITVNALMPGFTRTERLAELDIDFDVLADRIPARRLGEPTELAAMAAFLVSEKAAYINGQAIAVDGGLALGI